MVEGRLTVLRNFVKFDYNNFDSKYGHTYKATLSLVRSDTVKLVRVTISSAIGD
jgi:hypothetical protein